MFLTNGIMMEVTRTLPFQSNHLAQTSGFEWRIVRENRSYSCCREKRLNIDKKTFPKALFMIYDFMTCRTLFQGTKSKNNPQNLFWLEKLLIRSLIEEMKLVAMGEKRSWIWISRKAISNVFFSQKWDYQDSETRNKINDLSLQEYFNFVKFSIENSFDELKLKVAETYKYDYRAKTKRTALFSFFGLTGIPSKDQNRKLLNKILRYNWKLFDWDLVWNTETCNYWETAVWSSRQSNNYKLFCCFWLTGYWWK